MAYISSRPRNRLRKSAIFFSGAGGPAPSVGEIVSDLFLRKQLAVCLERQVKLRRATDATRLSLVFLSRLFEWRPALTMVTPEILIGWVPVIIGMGASH